MTLAFLISTSHPEHEGIDFAVAHSQGAQLVFNEASRGVSYRNPMYSQWRKEIEDAGLMHVPVHRVTHGSDNPAQWRNFAEVVGEPPRCILLDVAFGVDASDSDSWASLQEYVNLERYFDRQMPEGSNVLLRLPRWFWEACWKSPILRLPHPRFLLSARYVEVTGTPDEMFEQVAEADWHGFGFRNVDLLEFTSRAHVGGVSNVPCAATALSLSRLRVLARPANPIPSSFSFPTEDNPMLLRSDSVQAVTPIAFARGQCSYVSFFCDNELDGVPSQRLRVAVHSASKHWSQIETVGVESFAKTTLGFKEDDVDGISIRRIDEDVTQYAPVAYNLG